MHSACCVVFTISWYTYFSARIGWRFGRCAYIINLTKRTTCELQRSVNGSASASASGYYDSFKIYCKFRNFLSWKTKLFRQPRWRSDHIYSTQIASCVRWWIKLPPLVLSSSSKLGWLQVPFPKWPIEDGRAHHDPTAHARNMTSFLVVRTNSQTNSPNQSATEFRI